MAERIIVVLCLFGGFLWLRRRSRSVNLEAQQGRSLTGVFVLLPAALIGEKYLFDHWLHLGPWTDMLIKVLVTIANFPLVGYLFLRELPKEEEA